MHLTLILHIRTTVSNGLTYVCKYIGVYVCYDVLENYFCMWGISSNGRAPALHAGGTGIDTQILHIFYIDVKWT